MARAKNSATKVTKRRRRAIAHPVYGPLHPWRVCPIGQHLVRAHPRAGTKGVITFCRNNPSRRDQIYLHEIQEIAERQFDNLSGLPSSNDLGFPNGNEYDAL